MKKQKPLAIAFQKLLKNKLATLCFILLIAILVLVVAAPLFTAHHPEKLNPVDRLIPGFWNQDHPKYSGEHWLGTDEVGRDVWSRILYGGRISLAVGFVSTGIGIIFGTIFGVLAGYYKKLDNIIMRIMDIFFTFPGILLALLIVAMLGVNVINSTIAISVWSIPSFARMIRGRVLQVKEEEYITAVRSLGATDFWLIMKHVLPNALPTIIVISTMRIASSILSISTLSYLGMGVPPGVPEWGSMIATAKDHMSQNPYLVIIPGIAVILTVICFNILGDKLRDILDPSLRN